MFRKNCVFSQFTATPPSPTSLRETFKALNAMPVYIHSYWLATFCTTNSSRVLAKERWQTLENSWRKKTQYSMTNCTFSFTIFPGNRFLRFFTQPKFWMNIRCVKHFKPELGIFDSSFSGKHMSQHSMQQFWRNHQSGGKKRSSYPSKRHVFFPRSKAGQTSYTYTYLVWIHIAYVDTYM